MNKEEVYKVGVQQHDNIYLVQELEDINLYGLTNKNLIEDLEKVEEYYSNVEDLDLVYNLALEGLKEEDWGKVEDKLRTVYEELDEISSNEVLNSLNVIYEFSKIFEAIVYKVVTKKGNKTIKYEPRIELEGAVITPDFLINDSKVYEVKLSQNGIIKNEGCYKKVDKNYKKVYLTKNKEDSSHDISIYTLMREIEVENKTNLFYDERVFLTKFEKYLNYVKEKEEYYFVSKRLELYHKLRVLKVKLNELLKLLGE